MEIKKIKIGEGKLTIHYSRMVRDTHEETEIVSTERAKPSLYSVINKISPEVVKMCGLPEDWKEQLVVLGVAFKRDEGVLGVTISAMKTVKFSNSPLIINTPFATEKDAELENVGMPASLLKILRALEKEAEAFVAGDRAQMEIFKGPVQFVEEEGKSR